MLTFRAFVSEAMWVKADATPILAALGPGFELIGSVARKGQSNHDLDILRPGKHPWSGDPDPAIRRTLEGLGFMYAYQQVFSPADKTHSRKKFAPGWNEIHNFEHSTTHQRVEIWSVMPDTTAFGGA